MTAFILIDAEAFSFLVSSLFVAAAMFAMQTMRQVPPVFNYWSIAIAIGGLRYLSAYLVSVIGLQYTIIILDLIMIAQGILMLAGSCCLQKRPLPVVAMLIIGILLLIWGIATSKLAYSWLWHDAPILLAYSTAMITSGIMFISRRSRKGDINSLQVSVSGLIISSGFLYLLLLVVKTESNLHWFFVVDQGILIALGIVLVFGILNNLQNQMKHIDPLDRTTGAFSETYFSHLLNTELGRAQRYKRPFAYLLVNINPSGENTEANAQLIKAIVKSLRNVDFIGKIADTEFAIALPETAITEAQHVAERQLALVKDINDQHKNTANISIRVIITDSEPGDNADRIYSRSKDTLDKHTEPNKIFNSKQD